MIMLIPMSTPDVQAVYHADFSPVSATSPARPGELLIAAATGLGPTRPGVDPGVPFPAAPLHEVNSPVEVEISGKPADLMSKVGWPGTKDVYRVDFRVPDGVSGEAPIRLTAAWIAGAEFNLPVR